MIVTVFGATGGIGSKTVTERLENGHSVIAYVRNAGKVSAELPGRVQVIEGQTSDRIKVAEAVAAGQAVISALGPDLSKSATGSPLVEGTRNIIDAMKAHGIRRYIGHGTPSVKDPRESDLDVPAGRVPGTQHISSSVCRTSGTFGDHHDFGSRLDHHSVHRSYG